MQTKIRIHDVLERDIAASEGADPLSIVLDRYTYFSTDGRPGPHLGNENPISVIGLYFGECHSPNFLAEFRNWPPNVSEIDDVDALLLKLSEFISTEMECYVARDLSANMPHHTFNEPRTGRPIQTFTQRGTVAHPVSPLIKLPGGFNAELITNPKDHLSAIQEEVMEALCRIHDMTYAPYPKVIYDKITKPNGKIAIVRNSEGIIHGFVMVEFPPAAPGQRPMIILSGTFLSPEAQSHGILNALNTRYCKKFFLKHWRTGVDVACRTNNLHVLGAAYSNNGGAILPNKVHIMMSRAVLLFRNFNEIFEKNRDQGVLDDIVKHQLIELVSAESRQRITDWISQPELTREFLQLLRNEIVLNLNRIERRMAPRIKAQYRAFRQIAPSEITWPQISLFMGNLTEHFRQHQHLSRQEDAKWRAAYQILDKSHTDPQTSEDLSVQGGMSLQDVFPKDSKYNRFRNRHNSPVIQAAPPTLNPANGEAWAVVGQYNFRVMLRMAWNRIKRVFSWGGARERRMSRESSRFQVTRDPAAPSAHPVTRPGSVRYAGNAVGPAAFPGIGTALQQMGETTFSSGIDFANVDEAATNA